MSENLLLFFEFISILKYVWFAFLLWCKIFSFMGYTKLSFLFVVHLK
jgi:hypothetical protein